MYPYKYIKNIASGGIVSYIATASRTSRQAAMRKIPAVDPTQLVPCCVVLRARYKVHYGPADLRGRYKIYIYSGREDIRERLYICIKYGSGGFQLVWLLFHTYIYIYIRMRLEP